ncbi:MAG: zeta toxin family protein [Verrucomicrobia bacterium]|jgi:predicted ABC-type ATPase|nr:zeta toxin family protein [Verrucomicrobiota bacterium]
MPRKPANCHVIAGPNGAGKTTFATEFLPLYANCRNFINADLIARGLSPFDPNAGLLRAGRMVLERIAEFTEARTDFAFESTLAGRAYVPLLRRLKKSGFRLHLFYLWIPSAELALLRIRDRVESGGHNVPERDVRRRFDRTLANLFTLYRPLFDTLHFFNNSSDTPRLIFKDESGKTAIGDLELYERLRRQFTP